MKKAIIMLVSALMLPALTVGKEPAKPVTADAVQVLKIASQDGRRTHRVTHLKVIVKGTNAT